MQFKELTVEELARGYVYSAGTGEYTCIFCGEAFSEGQIYQKGARLVSAERAVREHMIEAHGGAGSGLIGLDKQVSGLSDTQKKILAAAYEGRDNKEIGQEMGISDATVRSHKFNIQKMKREARILLAILENIENEEARAQTEALAQQIEESRQIEKERGEKSEQRIDRSLTGNNLHPFFTQFYLK